VCAATNGARGDEAMLDLDALEPPKEQPPFTFKAGGKIWKLGTPERLDFRDQHRLRDGDNFEVLKACMDVVDPAQWAEFEKVQLKRPMDDEVVQLIIRGAGEHYGISLPESPASPASSNRAARRSKQTSRKRTAAASRTSRKAT
jgi:hypothetical protein